jgi:xanthine/uracil permease
MFVVFANMISMAFSQFDQEKDQNRIRFVIGISLLGGVGAMFVPAAAFEGIPPLLTSILNNGLILGSIIAIIADQMTIKMSHSKESSSN